MKNKQLFMGMLCLVMTLGSFGQRYMENLNRGLVAVRTSSGSVLVSWRILGPEYASNATYNLYRNNTLIASEVSVSNFSDQTNADQTYQVAPVIDGTELEKSEEVTPWANFYKLIPISAPPGGTTASGAYTYSANDCSVGDLDGDGDYELVIKWSPSNARDNSQGGFTGNTILEAIEMDGTSLWRIDLGINIRAGAHYTQFMVYDLDGDGYAEVACKTADGTVDGIGNVIGSSSADYRNSGGWVLSGPEYLTVFNGQTGARMNTVNYVPARGNVSNWGDDYGNRVDRFLAGIAYLDGVRPSLVMCRGYYTRTVLAAWDYRGGELQQRWVFDSDNSGNGAYSGQGNHNLAIADVDNDGRDEIMYGSCAIDDDGTGLYSKGLGHGDAGHLTDIDPNSPGLEYFMCHETANGSSVPGLSLRNAGTGEILFSKAANGDVGRCMAADIDPNHLGYEMWGSDGSGIYNSSGSVISTDYPTTAGGQWTFNFGIWWDGDVLRELQDRGVLTKWNYTNQWTDRVETLYNYGATPNNGTKSNPGLQADILGDWREEIIYRHADGEHLILFTTRHSTTQRMYTLMHDPTYRMSVAWQNVSYNQPPNLGFYFGEGMSTPPSPAIQMVSDDFASFANGVYRITPVHSGKSIEVANCGTTNGANAQQSSWLDNDCQKWQFTNVGSSSYRLSPVNAPSLGLDVSGVSVENGANVLLWDYVGGSNQKWRFRNAGQGRYQIVSNNSNKCLDVSNASLGDGANLLQYTCYEASHQLFYIQSVDDRTTLTLEENGVGFCSVDGSIDTNHAGYTGTGFVNTVNAIGSGVNWSVSIPTTGTYQLEVRYANNSSANDRSARLIVDGTTRISNISMPPTGSWSAWSSSTPVTLTLSAGIRSLRLEANGALGLANIDHLDITGTNPSGASCATQSVSRTIAPREEALADVIVYPSPVEEGMLNVSATLPSDAPIAVMIFDQLGRVRYAASLGEMTKGTFRRSIDLAALKPGMYLIKVIAGDEVKTKSFIVR